MLDWAYVILAMDYRNLHDLEAAGAPKDKVILLGEFGGVGPIADPYNRDDSEFERVFADIIKSIEGMLRNGC